MFATIAGSPRELISSILDAAPIPLVLNRIQSGEIVLVNELYCRLLGLPAESLVGRPVGEFYYDPAQRRALVAALLAGEAPTDYEILMKHADGRPIAAALSIRPLDFEGEPMVLTGVHDITARKDAEARLRASEQLLQTVFDLIPHWLYVKDRNSRYLMVNRAMAESFGLNKDDVAGEDTTSFRNRSNRRIGAPGQVAALVEMDRRAMATGAMVEEPAFTLECDDGSRRIHHIIKLPLRDESGAVSGIVGISQNVTEEELARQALAESEARFRDFAESSADWFWEMDGELRFTYMSPRIEDVLGIPATAYLGRRRSEMMSPEDDPAQWDPHLKRLEEHLPFRDFTYPRRLPSGEVKWLSSSGIPFFAPDGSFRGYRGIATDVTERVRNERDLADSRQRFQEFAETAADFLWELDADLRYTFLSSNIERITGMRPQDYYGKSRRDLLEPNYDKGHWEPYLAQLDAHEPIRNFTYRRYLPDGSSRWLIINGKPRFDENGKFLGYRGTGRDVTARVNAERELQESRHLLQTILDTLPHWISVRSADGRYQLANRALLEAYGKTASAVIGRTLGEAFQYPADTLEALRKATETVLATGQPQEIPESIMVRADGQEELRRLVAFPLANDTGDVTSIITWSEDITQRRRAEEDMRQAQKMEAIGQLSSGIAHDFNNVLQLINGYAQLVRSKLERGENVDTDVERIIQAADRGASLTDQLLTFSRHRVFRTEVVDLNAVIGNVTELLGRTLREDIELDVRTGEALPGVLADPGKLEQVLLNLCLNARDAMPEGGRMTVHTETIAVDDAFRARHPWAQADAYVALGVRDTGCGMTEEVRRRIFEPFFTTKGSGRGTGLGLAMAYGIVRQHGGHISVRSRPETGAAFTVYLPATDEPTTEVAPPAPPQATTAGQETILVAEDEPGVLQLVTTLLESMGYHVLTAANGEAALELFRERERDIDMVLLDVVMPRLGGRETFERIKETHPDMPVLFCSGYAANVLEPAFLQRPDVRLIHKPYAPAELARAVRETLDNRPG